VDIRWSRNRLGILLSNTPDGSGMKDKRNECGCHRGCIVLEHYCRHPCEWPGCLTPDELQELLESLNEDYE
jgi:hypothetical protein